MKLVKWLAEDSVTLFGSIHDMSGLPNVTEPKNIIPIAHTQNASEYVGLSFEEITPTECTEITDVPLDTYYFFHNPQNGKSYWLTMELVTIAVNDLREKELLKATVEFNGIIYDADEVSQDRISRTIVAMNDNETFPWKNYNNTFVELTKEELRSLLRLAGLKQKELWLKYFII
jgi:hypothetical protein